MIPSISVEEAKRKKDNGEDFVLLDVRTPQERELASLEGSLLIPLQELNIRIGELDKNKEIIVFCHHGGRSARATTFLQENGFTKSKNLEGGIDAWSKKIDNSIPRY